MLASRYAMWMAWGRRLTFFCNDAYRPTLGTKFPWALGQPTQEVWAEIWRDIGPRVESVLTTGEATWDEGLLLFLERRGFPEETYHTFSYSPIPDDAGAIGGMLCVVTEETERVIGERRLALLKDLAAQLAAAKSTDHVFQAVEICLRADPRDFPFSLIYTHDAETGGLRRRMSTSFPESHPRAPARLDAAALDELWPQKALVEGTETARTVQLSGDLPWPRGPWQRDPTHAMLLSIAQQGQTRPAGVFIAGLNPHRPLDNAYRDFLRLFVGQVSAGLANAQAYETERRRAEMLREIDHAKTTFFSNISSGRRSHSSWGRWRISWRAVMARSTRASAESWRCSSATRRASCGW